MAAATLPKFNPSDDRVPGLPMEVHELSLEKAVENLKLPRVRHACRSAFRHLKKSWLLHPIDPEMSFLRLITAEEEAATALIRALKIQKYPNASLLQERNHVHKSALWPFIAAVVEGWSEMNMVKPEVKLATSLPRVDFLVDIASLAGLDEPYWVQPEEPFHFNVKSDQTGSFELYDFSKELLNLAESRGASSIAKYVASEANRRNQVLYASDTGVPSIDFADSLILNRLGRVAILVTVVIAIMQTPCHQLFLVQCLEALLRAVQGVEIKPYDYPVVDPKRTRLDLVEQLDGTMKLKVVRPKISGYSFHMKIS